MLRKISKDSRPSSGKISKLQKKAKTIPISESFSDLKYLSSLCFTNFNGVFQNANVNNFNTYKKPDEISQAHTIDNLILDEQVDDENKKVSQSVCYKHYPISSSNTKLNSNAPSKKNLNASISTKSSFDEYNTNNKGKTLTSSKYSTLTPSSNQMIFKKINTYKKTKGVNKRSCSQPRIQKLTKLERSSNLSTIQDFETALNSLHETFLGKLRSKVEYNQKTNTQLTSSIKTLSSHVRSISQELDKSKDINISMTSDSVRMGFDLKRLLFQNQAIEKESQSLRNECENSRKTINELDSEKVQYENEISTFNDNIEDMKSQIRVLPKLIQRCEEDKKNLMTAILIVKKKSDEIRAEIYKMDNNKDYLGKDLEAILDYYKDAEI